MTKEKESKALVFIFITILLDVIGLGIIVPVLPTLIAHLIDGTISEAARYGGWLMFSYAVMQFIFAPILGGLSDKFGRRPVLLIALFGYGVDYILMALSPTIVWLFFGRAISGLTGASFTTASAYIADVSSPEKRAQNFGLIGAAFGLGFIIGPVLGGLLGHYGPRIPFFAAAGLVLINWLYGFFFLPESLPKDHRRPFEWRRANPASSLIRLVNYPVISGLVGGTFLLHLAGFATQSTWSYYTMEKFSWHEAQVGFSLGIVGLMIAIVQGGLIRVVVPKIGQKRAVFLGLTLYAISFVLFAFAPTGFLMLLFIIPSALGGLAGPTIQGIMAGQVPAKEQGELQGGLTGMVSVTTIIGPVMMTSLFYYFTNHGAPFYFPGAPFIAASLLVVTCLLLVLRTFKIHQIK
ncbi:MAG: TCR/Tet family MFS transporter [Saprospiraceae bacterium]|nr:TCR/Tet family MFS transporter [Saprospiraceae bacterium]